MKTFHLGDEILYMHQNKITSGIIIGRITIEMGDMETTGIDLKYDRGLFRGKALCNKSGVYYITNDGIHFEDECFPTQELLLASLVVSEYTNDQKAVE